MTTLDVKADFPILEPDAERRRIIYLDSAASSQKPRQVLDAVRRFYEVSNSNVHRGAYDLAVRATKLYEEARCKVTEFVGGYDSRGVIFTRGTTEAINLVANSWGRDNVRAGDTVVITALDHHSNIVPWQILAKQQGAAVRMVEVTEDGRLDLEDLRAALKLRPKIVALNYVSNALGTINPLLEIIPLIHEAGAVVLVDGAQSAPHIATSVSDLDIDFYAFSGHKMLGPMGIGALVARPELLDEMNPYQGGGEMIQEVGDEQSTYADIPAKFEAGTPNVAGAVGLSAAIDYLNDIGMDAIHEHETRILHLALERLSGIPGLKVFGPDEERAGVLSFALDDIHPHDLATVLDQEGVAIRAGHHCTQPLMRRLGVQSTARASFYVYNDESDVEVLACGLEKAKEIFSYAA
ncbi:MAG: cysteine desulfurase [Gemmatimonadetes bacterium]|nr:cysteine desulfurase [Gemmatimonadota bacterium]